MSDIIVDEFTCEETNSADKAEDLDLRPDAEVAISTSLKNTFMEKSGTLGQGDVLNTLKIYLGANYQEESVTETGMINQGELNGTPNDPADAQRVEFVKLTIENNELENRIDKYKATIPQEDRDKKDDFFPHYRSLKGGHLFNMPGDMEGKHSGIFITRNKYENEKEPTKVTFYIEKGRFETISKKAVGSQNN